MEKIKAFIKRHIDYRIVGEYIDMDSKTGRGKKKYIKKYYFRW